MFCAECGKEVKDTDYACPNCGAPIKREEEIKTEKETKKFFDKDKMNIPAMVACGLVILSTEMTFYRVTLLGAPMNMSMAGTPDGTIITVLAILGLLTALLGWNGLTESVGVLELLIVFAKYRAGGNTYASVAHGTGYYLFAASSIAIIITAAKGYKEQKAKKKAKIQNN